jgi:hypothetical protein
MTNEVLGLILYCVSLFFGCALLIFYGDKNRLLKESEENFTRVLKHTYKLDELERRIKYLESDVKDLKNKGKD